MLRTLHLALLALAFCTAGAAAQAPAPQAPAPPPAPQAPAPLDLRALFPLLVDLPGWTAEDPDQEQAAPGGQAVTAAGRLYRRGDAALDVAITAGPLMADAIALAREPPAIAGRTQRTATIAGFPVVSSVAGSASEAAPEGAAEGLILIVLSEGAMVPAVFIVQFEAMALAEALALAQRFDWAAMRSQLRPLR